MTAVAHLQHSAMDLLRADDQMDVASSPGMPTVDLDFELNDVREMSSEPNQDLMSPGDSEQPAVESDSMRPSRSDRGDDLLMLDEDTTVAPEDQSGIPELSMGNHQDERVPADEDDDILYEDEDDLQDQEGRLGELSKEQEMEDDVSAEVLQANQKVEISDLYVDELQTTTKFIDVPEYPEFQEAGETDRLPEQLQTVSAGVAVDANNEIKASAEYGSDAKSEPGLGLTVQDDTTSEDVHGQNTNNQSNAVDSEALQTSLRPDTNATGVHDQNADAAIGSGNLLQPEVAEFDANPEPEADVASAHGEATDVLSLQNPLLHTVKVHYLETEMSLFPPTKDDDSEMFFLQDVGLANVSLDKMLAACKEVLANTIGQDDELVLDIASLGLHISEGSRYASQITLSQIIDVYIALAHNDNFTDLEPLYCSLTSRVCLASQYSYLQSAANEGKTLTQILEENNFLSGENGIDGEDGTDGEEADVHPHEVSVGSEDSGRVVRGEESEHVPSTAEREPVRESTNIYTKPGIKDNQRTTKGGLAEADNDASEHEYGDWKVMDPHEKDQSATSTVKGETNEFEDNGISTSKKCDDEQSAGELLAAGSQVVGDHGGTESDAAENLTHMEKPDIVNCTQESVSSRTIEAENSQPEDDTSSQNKNQTFGSAHGSLPETQFDDADEFGLEEEDYDDASSKVGNMQGGELYRGIESDDLAVEHVAPSSAYDPSNNASAPDENKDNRDSTYVENDDDILDFEGEEEGRKEENGQLPGTETTYIGSAPNVSIEAHDANETYDENPGHPENGSPARPPALSGSQVSPTHSMNSASGEPTEYSPNTPSGGQNGSKRKVLEDEDDFDLFDTFTPEKKRRRSS